jgi:ABC-type lipoprotein export system ATPase subunit
MPVRVEGLRKEYAAPGGGRQAILDIPELRLLSGERVALTGPSGAGKSTLLHLLAGTLLPDAGVVAHDWDGTEVALSRLPEARRDRYRGRWIGCVFQGNHLLPALSARDNVLLGLAVTGRKVDAAWAEHLLQSVGLRERMRHLPSQLSPGQRLRVACARALAARPALLLIDEPTAALDAASATQVVDVLLSLAEEIRACVLVITHDPQVAARVGRTLPLGTINRAQPC